MALDERTRSTKMWQMLVISVNAISGCSCLSRSTLDPAAGPKASHQKSIGGAGMVRRGRR